MIISCIVMITRWGKLSPPDAMITLDGIAPSNLWLRFQCLVKKVLEMRWIRLAIRLERRSNQTTKPAPPASRTLFKKLVSCRMRVNENGFTKGHQGGCMSRICCGACQKMLLVMTFCSEDSILEDHRKAATTCLLAKDSRVDDRGWTSYEALEIGEQTVLVSAKAWQWTISIQHTSRDVNAHARCKSGHSLLVNQHHYLNNGYM